MKYKHILAIDPSGSFHEGKGTTGYCVFNTEQNVIMLTGCIKATDHALDVSYWQAHLHLLNKVKRLYPNLIIVIEDYLLYANKAEQQINSRMETSKLIGVIQQYCWTHKIPYKMQIASEVKSRWTDKILEHKGYIKKVGGNWYSGETCETTNKHSRDAIRHAVHYNTFRNK